MFKQRSFQMIAGLVFLTLPLSAFARRTSHSHHSRHTYTSSYGQCGHIEFNCDKHMMTLGNLKSPINCGRSTPTSHSGTIGMKSSAQGSVWPSMRGAPIINIGLAKENVVIHTLPPKRGRVPAGYNTMSPHTGCINVSPAMFAKLRQCRGTPYKIVFNSKFQGGNTRYARRTRRTRTRYASRSRRIYYDYADASW